jgi:environmental stress-induced protein Ves
MRTIHIPKSAGRIIPWANGLGTSREIILQQIAPPQDPPTLLWRLATTRIERDCPFSPLPAQDRTIVLLNGNGFELIHDAAKAQTVMAPLGELRFGGDWGTRCRLLDGPVEVLNLMAARNRVTCSLVPVALEATGSRYRITASTKALYVLRGEVSAQVKGDPAQIVQAGDALRFDADTPLHVELHATDSSAALVFLEVQSRRRDERAGQLR